jgi:uncharacterized protein YjbI with pentapeptide repeats
MGMPVVHRNALFELLRTEQVAEFNKRKAAGEPTADQLRGGDFRSLDLRGLDADGLDLRDAYFRGADLRGIDFRNANLEGASFCQAHVSGCFFPKGLWADEIRLSMESGVRVRLR